jgi:pimeloyl-ACP methyl ester carboxylesterase
MFHVDPRPSEALEDLFGTETIASLREVVLMPRDLAPVVPESREGDDVVVLIHGFFATAGVFRPMRGRLEREVGARVATFTHAPGVGVNRIAKQLARVVEKIPEHARVHLVGHSLGGAVARYFVQELEGHERVVQTISLASPFGGAALARRMPVFVGADLHAASDLLARIRSRAHVGAVPHTSIVGGEDRMVVGAKAATLPRSDVVVLPGRGHNTLLYDEAVVQIVLDRIRRFQRQTSSHGHQERRAG